MSYFYILPKYPFMATVKRVDQLSGTFWSNVAVLKGYI